MSNNYPLIRTGIGQDSHRFLSEDATKPCVIAGLIFEEVPGFKGNSDGDVVFHAICNAITSLTGVLILGEKAEELIAKDGITDSQVYLEEAMKTLGGQKILHLAITLEAQRPHFKKRRIEMCRNIAQVLRIEETQVGLTATTGEGLTDFGCGDGVQCFCILTTIYHH